MSTQAVIQPQQDDRLAKLDWYGRVLTGAMVVLAIAGLIAVYAVTTRHPQTDDAEIFANYIGIAPVVEGPILHLNVADNQHVKRGDLLFEIDDRPYKYALDKAVSDQATLEGEVVDEQRRIGAEVHAVTASGAATRSASANVDRAQASIREAEADVAHSEAALDRAKAESAYAEKQPAPRRALLAKQYVTVDQVDQARTTERASAQSVHEAESQLALNGPTSIPCWPPWRRPRPRQTKVPRNFTNHSPAYLPLIPWWRNGRGGPRQSPTHNTTTTSAASMLHSTHV